MKNEINQLDLPHCEEHIRPMFNEHSFSQNETLCSLGGFKLSNNSHR